MAEPADLLGFQSNCATFGYMTSETAILLQEKLAVLEGSLRQLKDEKFKLLTEIDWLKKENKILMQALDQFHAAEQQSETLEKKNILLESQLHSLLKAIEKMESDNGSLK
jgi:hypothetical protein